MKLVTVGPDDAGGPNSAAAVYVYPYYFSIDGSPDLVGLICDDYDHDVYLGETWTAERTSLNQGSLAPTSSLTIVQTYREVAWLFDQLAGIPSLSQAAAINFAIWALFSAGCTKLERLWLYGCRGMGYRCRIGAPGASCRVFRHVCALHATRRNGIHSRLPPGVHRLRSRAGARNHDSDWFRPIRGFPQATRTEEPG